MDVNRMNRQQKGSTIKRAINVLSKKNGSKPVKVQHDKEFFVISSHDGKPLTAGQKSAINKVTGKRSKGHRFELLEFYERDNAVSNADNILKKQKITEKQRKARQKNIKKARAAKKR